MYYEEKVVDGVLCWRSKPDGAWTQFTAQELTVQVVQTKQAALALMARVELAEDDARIQAERDELAHR